MPTGDRRAAPLPPDDRRRAIIGAVLPLLLDRGAAVTSREMAEAAGVAEGTIFRVFPDKRSVIVEAIKVSLDPAPAREALAGISKELSLEAQLGEAARILIGWSEPVAGLVGILRTLGPPASPAPPKGRAIVGAAMTVIRRGLVELFERHRDRLRVTPAQAAAAFHGLVFAAVHPVAGIGEGLDAGSIVDVVVNGVVVREDGC